MYDVITDFKYRAFRLVEIMWERVSKVTVVPYKRLRKEYIKTRKSEISWKSNEIDSANWYVIINITMIRW